MHEEVELEAQEKVSLDLDVLSYDDWEDGEATPHNCALVSSD